MPEPAYEAITERVLTLMAQGTTPWRQPWRTPGPPHNLAGRPYRGINLLMLIAAGYASPVWGTYAQIVKAGGRVRRGEKATKVVFWKLLEPKNQGTSKPDDRADNSDDRESDAIRPAALSKKVRRIPLARLYSVFNAEQCDGLHLPDEPTHSLYASDPIAAAESIVARMPSRPSVVDGGSRAYYAPSDDTIHVPPPVLFRSSEERYATLFHELAHSTGAKHRLNRAGISDFDHFGSDRYGREELVAELTAAFLCGEAGISPLTVVNSAAYLRGWIDKIHGDNRLVVVAAGQAQRAADFILRRGRSQ